VVSLPVSDPSQSKLPSPVLVDNIKDNIQM
jgi:hypothetical protein